MNKLYAQLCLITLSIEGAIAIALLTRISIKHFYNRIKPDLHEVHLFPISILLMIGAYDLYLLVSGYYLDHPLTYFYSYGYPLVGPVIYGVVRDRNLIDILKLKRVNIPIPLFIIGTQLFLYFYRRGKVHYELLGHPYYISNLYALVFIIGATVILLTKGRKDPRFKFKLILTFLFILHGLTSFIRLGVIGFAIVIGTFLLGFIYYTVAPLINVKEKYNSTKQSTGKKIEILSMFEKVMEIDKPFLEYDCRLDSVATHLGVRRDLLSQVINSSYGKSFSDVINESRIDYSITLLNSPMSILDIAMESGFSSKSTFYTYFKKKTGMTPLQYRKKSSKL